MKAMQSIDDPGDLFLAAIEADLPKGERIIAATEAFDVLTKTTVNNGRQTVTITGVVPYHVVLTNLAVRTARFAAVTRWEGWRPRRFRVPTVEYSRTIPIGDIASTSIEHFEVKRRLGKILAREFAMPVRPSDSVDVTLWTSNGRVIVSGVEGLADLHRTLDDLRAGRLIATEQARAGAALEQLAELLRAGLITQSEFDSAKGAFLGAEPNQAARALSSIQSLHHLLVSGALTEGVYRMAVGDALVKLERSS